MLEKICEFCNSSFKTNNKNKRCCNRSCTSKLQWKNNRDYLISCKNTESARKNNSDAQKKKWLDLEFKNKMKIKKIKYANSQIAKEKFIKRIEKWRNENPNDYLKMRKGVANKSSVKKATSITHKKLWNNPEYRNKQIKKFSDGQLRRWSNVESIDKHFKNSVKYKEYKLPSGRIVKVQGYEPQALDKLLQLYDELDIIIGVKNIHTEIGKIKYFQENKERSYYPDFYIKSINTIIEVKSTYTYNLHKIKNELKKQACINAGLNFKFMFF